MRLNQGSKPSKGACDESRGTGWLPKDISGDLPILTAKDASWSLTGYFPVLPLSLCICWHAHLRSNSCRSLHRGDLRVTAHMMCWVIILCPSSLVSCWATDVFCPPLDSLTHSATPAPGIVRQNLATQ